MIIQLPKLHPWQKDLYNDALRLKGTGSRLMCKAKRQCGKSFTACMILISYSLTWKTQQICIEPTLSQSRRMFKDIMGFLGGSGIVSSSNSSLLEIEFVNGSRIIFKSAEQKDSLRGMTATGIMIIDEGAFIPDDIYEILFPCTDAHSAPIVIISTPLFKSGLFWKLWNTEASICHDWSLYDTSVFLSPEKLSQYRKELGELKFRSEYLGEFIDEGSIVFGNLGACIKDYEGQPKEKIYAGIDWGCGGGDFTVISLVSESLRTIKCIGFNNLEPLEQIDKIVEVCNQYKPTKILVELNSIGKVYYDLLRRKVRSVNGFTTTNDSKRKIIEKLRELLESGKLTIPNDKELIKELQHYEIEKTKTGYTYNAAKGYHDDYIMSLGIACECVFSTASKYKVSIL